MRWRLTLGVLTLGAILAVCGPRTAIAQTDEPAQNLIQQGRAVKFRFILGRLSLDPPTHVKCTRSAESPCGAYQESLRVTASRGIPSLHYQWTSPNRSILVDVEEAEHVRIESNLRTEQENARLIINQPLTGDLFIDYSCEDASGRSTDRESIKSPSLAHLRVSHRKLYDQHVQPALQHLLPAAPAHCEPEDLLRAINVHHQDALVTRQQITTLVDQLRASSRSARLNAERQLREIGIPALSVIDQLDQRNFEVEQRERLLRIRSQLQPRDDDTPQRLARWLAADVRYWNHVSDQLSPREASEADRWLRAVAGQGLSNQIRVAEGTGTTLR